MIKPTKNNPQEKSKTNPAQPSETLRKISNKLKSQIVSSPAGSGKTQKLAERYIKLLQQSVPPERILTITFTDKAAAEMKDRIFKILKEKDPPMYDFLKEKSLRLRIQTIDSFCLSLLKRFAKQLDLQPDLEVLPAPDAIWTDSVYDTLMTIAEKERASSDYNKLMDLIVEEKFKGWLNLKRLFDNLFTNRLSIERAQTPVKDLKELEPLIKALEANPISQEKLPKFLFRVPTSLDEIDTIKSELIKVKSVFLTQGDKKRSDVKHPALDNWYSLMLEYWRFIQTLSSNIRFKKIFDLFDNRFLAEYDKRKKVTRQVDFSDLELKTYEVLTKHHEWSNILYLFDEHTDHILVDEFQDTSFLQWAIITKLAEEWLSGMGAKRERGIEPTIFLVGDDKQSIYLFRNAHSEIFEHARNHLESRLNKNQFEFEKVKENYRSLQAIIDFTNFVFLKLMSPPANAPAWITRYAEFVRKRDNTAPGIVEIILAPLAAMIEEARAKDAELVAHKIKTLICKPIVFDNKENVKECRYEDIAILLRSRTHLPIYENTLRKYDIPFVVVKGIGFNQTPEIGIMRSLVSFLTDTTQDFDLYVVLKSPLFGLSEKEILIISQSHPDEKLSLWDRLKDYATKTNRRKEMIERMNKWISQVGYPSMAEILEEILEHQQGWKIFWEPQRTVNIKKFLRIIENLESEGAHPLMISDYFEKNRKKNEEPKANVNIEGRNEIKLMTIHAAKGLQFPIVFLVGLDENLEKAGNKTSDLLISEANEKDVWVSYEPENYLRKLSPLFIEQKAKEEEEEKRVFYVGVTRARDALFLTGIYNPETIDEDKATRLHWLKDFLDIKQKTEGNFTLEQKVAGLSIISEKELSEQAKSVSFKLEEEVAKAKTLNIEPITEEPEYEWQTVTRELSEIYSRVRRSFGIEWITLGDILHKIFENISKSHIKLEIDEIIAEAKRLFIIKNIAESSQEKLLDEITKQSNIIKNPDIASIILPQANSYTELPFVLKQDRTIYSGRIDRIIIKDDTINIYDYKTFPVQETELKELAEKYKSQLSIYQKAVSEIFPNLKTQTFFVFTAIGKIRKIAP